MKVYIKKKFKENNGSALLLTLLILTSILVVALGAAGLIVPGIKMSRTQEQSTKAFFAAEAGAERALWEVRKNGFPLPGIDTVDVFPGTGNLDNDSIYQIDYSAVSPVVTFTSTGQYQQTRRSVAVDFEVLGEYSGGCIPDCEGKLCGADDGCDGGCPSTCNFSPGCSSVIIPNAVITGDSCCEGDCYKCDEGYYWDGTSCVHILFDADTLDGLHWLDIKAYIDFKF